jgi:putative aldouronate transport system substrate-binding protein
METQGSTAAEKTTASTQPAAGGETAKKEAPVKLTVELFDRNNVPEGQGTISDNRWTKWIKEQVLAKRNIDVEFVIVPRSEEIEKLNVLMASGKAPDISYTFERARYLTYAANGGLTDLSEALAKYGTNINKQISREVLDYGVLYEKQYAIPQLRYELSNRVEFIRKDWLDKLGLPIPKTRDEFTNTMIQFVKQDPGKMGKKLVPWGLFPANTDAWLFPIWDIMYSFMKHDVEKAYTTPWPMREGFKDFMQWMNYLYKEGVIYKEFATDAFGDKKQQIANGQVGFLNWGTYSLANGDYYSTLQKNVPGAEFVAFNCFANQYDGKFYKSLYTPVGRYNFVPKTCKNPEAAVQYLDFLSEEETMWMLSYGVENEQYKLVDGVPTIISADTFSKTFSYISGDLNLMYEQPPIDREKYYQTVKTKWGAYGDFVVESTKLANIDGITLPVLNIQIAAEAKYGDELLKTSDEYWVKMITTKDFEAEYQSFMKDMEARGMKDVFKERTDYYSKNVKK